MFLILLSPALAASGEAWLEYTNATPAEVPHRIGVAGALQVPVSGRASVEGFLRVSGARQRFSEDTMAALRTDLSSPDLTLTWNDAYAELRTGARLGEDLSFSGGVLGTLGHTLGLSISDPEVDLRFDVTTMAKFGAYLSAAKRGVVGPVRVRAEAMLAGVAPVYVGGGTLVVVQREMENGRVEVMSRTS
jgi:hypothetical protein